MHRAENKIESLPIFLDPRASRCRSFRIVIQLDAGTNFHVRVRLSQPLDFVEINPFVIAIVIGKCDVAQPARACRIHPRLQQFTRVRLHAMPLRMRVVVGKKSHFTAVAGTHLQPPILSCRAQSRHPRSQKHGDSSTTLGMTDCLRASVMGQ